MIVIKHPTEDSQGNAKENVFIATCEEGRYLGHSYVDPLINDDVTPLNPYNLYIDAVSDDESIKTRLALKAIERAKELRALHPELPARIYAGCLIEEKSKLAFYESLGLIPDDGAYLYERILDEPIKTSGNVSVIWHRFDDSEARRELFELYNSIFVQKLDEDGFNKLKAEPGFICCTVFNQNRMVANMILYEKGDAGYIENLFVSKPARRKGLGKELLSLSVNHFIDKGLRTVQLSVWGRNVNAVALYTGLGFKLLKALEIYPGINL